jgi:predicted  nucleic acid-binding Zn-ribbon protein
VPAEKRGGAVATAETLSALNLIPFSGVASDVPADDSEAVEIYLSSARKAQLKQMYGWGTGLPELSREGCAPERLAQANALRSLAADCESARDREKLERKARRFEICGRVAELFECGECGRSFKGVWSCTLRSCPNCGKKIFNRAFAELVSLDEKIPASLRSLPGWGWKILDFSFKHDGGFPKREQMRRMRVIVNRVTDRAVREKCRELYRAGKGCTLRFDARFPMEFEGWPVVSAPDGSARVLEGWAAVQVGGLGKCPTCLRCGSRVKKIKGERARLCPRCGSVEWPDWENRDVDTRRWKLRFGIVHVPVSEFGFDNTNYHFHTCFFGPFLKQDRLAEIFAEETGKPWEKGGLGEGSRIVWIQAAKRGYRSALAHALKYTSKMPSTTPERLARYEQVLMGVRRYAVRGYLQGVRLEEKKRGLPECPVCKIPLKRVAGLGIVPLSEIQGIPLLPDDDPDYTDEYRDDECAFYEPEEAVAHAPRAPC